MVQQNTVKFSRLPYYLSSLASLVNAMTFSERVRFFSRLPSPQTVRFNNPHDLSFEIQNPLDLLILKEVLFDHEYEALGVRIEASDKVIVDVGAGFGDFVISTAKRFPKARIFAVEIDPNYLSLLKKNLHTNMISTVTIINKPIHSLTQLALLVRRPIDFLKIDCEGCEYPLFMDVTKKELGAIKKISMEYHEFGGKRKEIIMEQLFKAHFDVFEKPIHGTPGTGHIAGMRRRS